MKNKNDINPWDVTPDLSQSFSPVPKVYKSKKAPTRIKVGVKVMTWEEGRKVLKVIFKDNGITACEVMFKGCKKDNYLTFAHKRRRNTLKPDEVVDPHYVVLSCQPCHDILDHEMKKVDAESLMDRIIDERGW